MTSSVSIQFYLSNGEKIQVSICFQKNFHQWKTRFISRKFFHHITRSYKIFHWWEEFIHFTEFYKALPPSILLTTQQCKQTQFLTILIDGRLKRKISTNTVKNFVHHCPFLTVGHNNQNGLSRPCKSFIPILSHRKWPKKTLSKLQVESK